MITHNTNYISEGLARLPEQFKNKPRLAALLTAFLTQAQAAEDAAFDLMVNRLLQNSPTGDLLDKLGKIVGQERNGLDDATYLLYVRARIATNRSSGKREELIGIAALIVSNATIYAQDLSPASFLIYPEAGITSGVALTLALFLSSAIAAGVNLGVFWSLDAPSNTLTWGSVHGLTPTANQSPGSVHTGGTGGGLLAGVLG